MITLNHYNAIANLFRYPKEDYVQNVNECARILKENYPKAYNELLPFIGFINSHPLFEIEEVFGKTFHIQAICYLDLGYVLFGEDYKRGEFLVQMKNEQRKVNNDCGHELADNLPNVLSLLPLIKDKVFLNELSVRVIMVAIEKMLQEFDASRMALKDKVRKKKQKVILLEDMANKNIYQYALQATLKVFQQDFKGLSYNDPKISPSIGGDILKNCGSCASPTTLSANSNPVVISK
ncbi:MAG: hypothetical protein ACLGGV_02125 [Bacteroidia bacterium]